MSASVTADFAMEERLVVRRTAQQRTLAGPEQARGHVRVQRLVHRCSQLHQVSQLLARPCPAVRAAAAPAEDGRLAHAQQVGDLASRGPVGRGNVARPVRRGPGPRARLRYDAVPPHYNE
jgi:hypothetical protein